jgi:hypothetical protein
LRSTLGYRALTSEQNMIAPFGIYQHNTGDMLMIFGGYGNTD